MSQAASIVDSSVVQETGTVLSASEQGLRVRTSAGIVLARRALSCLVAPEPGDCVLLATEAAGRAFVLAVLERSAPAVTLALDGDCALRAGGRLSLTSAAEMQLTSAAEVSLAARGLSVNAVEGNVALQSLTFVGRLLHSEIERIKSFAGTLDRVLDRLSERVQRSYRRVEELEDVRAARMRVRVDKTLSLHGENTIVTAEELFKVDGEQIHLG